MHAGTAHTLPRPAEHGRGAAGKIAFLAAVQASNDGRPLYLKLRRIRGFTRVALREDARHRIASGSHILSDGLGCFRGFARAEHYTHEPRARAAACPAPSHFECPTFRRLLKAAASGAIGGHRREKPPGKRRPDDPPQWTAWPGRR